ncbi:MAG: PQQ-binding-like beta-propeller repeat protein [Planctomycetota bacterium]
MPLGRLLLCHIILVPLCAQSVGYRGDGTGRYPDATPPTAWNIHDRTNVRWLTPLVWSKAAPIVVGERIYCCEEPHTLVCLDRDSGDVIWRRPCNILELVAPQAMPEATELEAAAAALHAEELALGAWYGERIAALIAQGMERAAAEQRVWRMHAATRTARKRWVVFLHERGGTDWPICYHSATRCGPWCGFSFATPTSDGERVYVKFGTGVTACFTPEGERVWMRHTPLPMTNGSEASSPLLVDDLLVLQMAHEQEAPQWMKYDKVFLLALDTATGAERWRTDARDYRPNTTPVALRLPLPTGGTLSVIITGSGTVVRAADGKVVAQLPGNHDDYGGITVHEDVLYRSDWGAHGAVRVAAVDRDRVTGELLWQEESLTHGGGLAWHDGVLSGLVGTGTGHGLDLFDAATGKRIAHPQIDGARNVGALRWAAVWIPPTVTRDHVYHLDRGTSGGRKPFPHAALTVVQRGRDGRIVAHNDLPRTTDTPLVPDGDRLYARVDDGLLCIEHTDATGRAYEARLNVRLLCEDIPAAPPPRRDALAIAPVALPQTEVETLAIGYRLFFKTPRIGPVAPDQVEALTTALLAVDGGFFTRGELTRGAYRLTAAKPTKDTFDALVAHNSREVLDCARLPHPTGQTLFTVEALRCEREQILRVDTGGAHLAQWISGTRVRDRDRIHLAPGVHVFLLRMRVAATGPAPLYLRLTPSADQDAERAAWHQAVARNRAVFARAVELAPDSAAAAAARERLEQLAP